MLIMKMLFSRLQITVPHMRITTMNYRDQRHAYIHCGGTNILLRSKTFRRNS